MASARQLQQILYVLIVVLSLLASVVLAQSPAPPRPKSAAQPQLLKVPPGFDISVWSSDVPSARSIASTEVNGSTIVYVGSATAGNVYYVVDRDSDGTPDVSGKLLSGVDTPNGVAVRGQQLFVSGFANGKGVIWRLDNVHDYALTNKPYTGTKKVITDRLPGEANHGRRFLRFSPKGLLVLGIGVPCNVCKLDRTANGIQYGSLYTLNVTDGKLQQIATGVRNSVGFDWHPQTGVLYFTDNGRDRLGDNSPDCELNRLPGPDFATSNPPSFGFPYCQTQGQGDPYKRSLGGGVPLTDPDLNPGNGVVNCSAPGAFYLPVQALGPHTAPLGMRFYRWRNTAAAFPASYNNTIFIVERGSWNRAMKIGYRVMQLKLNGAGEPVDYREFASGWLQNQDTARQYSWGRPVDVEQLPDGALLVSDDEQGMLYRIAPTGAAALGSSSSSRNSSSDEAGLGAQDGSSAVVSRPAGQAAASSAAEQTRLGSRSLMWLAVAVTAVVALV